MAKPFNAQELFDEHLRYECLMFVFAKKALASPRLPRPFQNAMIECFCLHARNLIEFFNCEHVDTSRFVESTYKPWSAGKVRKNLKTKLNTHVAHLTPARTTDPNKKIHQRDRAELMKCIGQELRNFCAHLKPGFDPAVLLDIIDSAN